MAVTLIKKYRYHVCSWIVMMVLNYSAICQDVIGVGVGYEYFPHAALVSPMQSAPDLEIETSSRYISLAIPFDLKKGKIKVFNRLNYKKIYFEYKNFPAGGTPIDHVQYIDYSFFMIDSLNTKWKLAAMINPIIASDFGSSITKDDFILGGILGLIRTVNPKLDWGFGLAYMSDFGNPIPLPFIYLDWKPTPKMILQGIIPSNLLLGRKMTNWYDMGIELAVDGNRFHGNPSKFGTSRPFMRYSEGTLSLLSRFHLMPLLHLNVLTGWGFYRNFEFYEGNDKVQSFDLKKVPYLSAQVIIGI